MVWEFLGSEPQFAEPSARPVGAVPCTAAKWVSDPNNSNQRCSPKAGTGTNSPSAQTSECPDPLLPALLGPARRVGGTNTDAGSIDALCASSPPRIRIRPPNPSGWAENRSRKLIKGSDCLSRRRVCACPRFWRAPQVGVIGVRHPFRCSALHRTLRASRRLGELGL